MSLASRTLHALAEEVRKDNERDEALTKIRSKTKVEQRDLRLKMGQTAAVLQTDQEFSYVAGHAGLTVARLKDYVFVRKQWPNGTFPADSNYTALEELARDADRFNLITPGMSKRDARAAKGGKVDTPSRWSPKVKADFVKEAMSNPEVARQIAGDQSARAAMAEAEWALAQERRAAKDAANPGRKAIRENTEKAELLRSLDNIQYALVKAVEKARDLGVSGDVDFVAAAREVEIAASWLTTVTPDFDTALARLTEENS